MKHSLVRKITTVVSLILAATLFTGTLIADANANNISSVLGAKTFETVETGEAGQDTEYYKSEYSSVGALREAGHRTAEEVLEEGAVLLKNENGALPLSARANGVLLTFMGDGKELSFMDEMDIYSLFGNLLDNAIAAVEKLESAEAKLVSMVVERRGDFCLINIMNYYGEPLAFRDGLPETTKREEPGFHGYGLRSIRRIAQKYGGELQISAEDGIFRAMVYLMDCAEEPQKAG